MLADAEGARGRVYAGGDEVPQVGFGEPAVVPDERGEAVLGEVECERETNGAQRGRDREGLADAGKDGAGAGKGLVVETPVLTDGAYGAGSIGGGRMVGRGGGWAGGGVRGRRGGEAGWGRLRGGGSGCGRVRGRRRRRGGDGGRRGERRGRMGAEGEDLLVFPVEVELQEAQAGGAIGGTMEVDRRVRGPDGMDGDGDGRQLKAQRINEVLLLADHRWLLPCHIIMVGPL